jgi:hypothetical protein
MNFSRTWIVIERLTEIENRESDPGKSSKVVGREPAPDLCDNGRRLVTTAEPHVAQNPPEDCSSTMSLLDDVFELLQVATRLEETKGNRIEAATKVSFRRLFFQIRLHGGIGHY